MRVHNALPSGTLEAAARRALGDTQTEGGLERYSETLDLNMDLWALPEWRYLRRERACQYSSTEGVGAGRSRLGIQNATTTDLVVVEWIQNRGAAGNIALTLGFGLTVDSLEVLRPTDTRWFTPTAGASVTTITHRQGAIGGTTTAIGAVYAVQGQIIPVNFVLGPSWHLSCDPNADATAITLAFGIRERSASRGEL